jgi:uncharacterized membrane protein YphA (DoxX/SURF4 family)
MDASLITLGADAPNAVLTLNRVALGTFFAISGYHKLFNASGHATLTHTLQDDGVRAVPIMQWLVPGIEFSAGCALILGLLSALAAFGLFVICLAPSHSTPSNAYARGSRSIAPIGSAICSTYPKRSTASDWPL